MNAAVPANGRRGGYHGGVPLYIKFGFGIGKSADAVVSFWFGTLLLIYYNQVLGLPGWLTGLAVMIGLLFDAVTDPAVGGLSDGFQSRLGRRHPFILGSAIPIGICFFLLFAPPPGLGTPGLFLWLVCFGILTRFATTFFNVPYMSLGAEFTSDYAERTTIVAWRTFFHVFTGALVAVFVWGYFDANGAPGLEGQLVASNYVACALVMSVVMTVAITGSALLTLPSVPHLLGAGEAARKFTLAGVFVDLKLALGSRSFRALFAGVFLISVYVGVQAALGTHLLTFFWQLQELEIRNWQIFAGIGGAMAVLLARHINTAFDKRNSVLGGVALFAAASTGPVLLQLVGGMPTDRDVLVWSLYGLSLLAALGGVLAVVTGGSMMADIADEHELNHGVRQEGIYFGSLNFAGKATTAFGHLIAGITVDVIGLDPRSTVGSVHEAVILNFGISYSVFIVFMIASAIALLPYNLDRARHDEIVRALVARRARGEDVAAG